MAELSDPVKDPRFPRITAYVPGHDDPIWPRGWGAEPTERDQAVIDAALATEQVAEGAREASP